MVPFGPDMVPTWSNLVPTWSNSVPTWSQVLGIHLKTFHCFELYNAKSPISNTGGGYPVRCKFLTFPKVVTDLEDSFICITFLRRTGAVNSTPPAGRWKGPEQSLLTPSSALDVNTFASIGWSYVAKQFAQREIWFPDSWHNYVKNGRVLI
jgi:hypothetical protein